MANFGTHLIVGAVASGLVATATYAADIVPFQEIVTMTAAGIIGSVLPDVDLEHGMPARMLFTGLGIVFAFLALFQFSAAYSIIELWLIWIAVFVGVRVVGWNAFHRTTVHRGIFHSLLAGAFFMALTASLAVYGLHKSPTVAWLTGAFVLFGYLVHLVLDELYSVDFAGKKVKRSFGTALKLFDYRAPGPSALMAGALAAVLVVAPPAAGFLEIVNTRTVGTFLRERMLPEGEWFAMHRYEALRQKWRQPEATGTIAPLTGEN